jgi:hypothetical protein
MPQRDVSDPIVKIASLEVARERILALDVRCGVDDYSLLKVLLSYRPGHGETRSFLAAA